MSQTKTHYAGRYSSSESEITGADELGKLVRKKRKALKMNQKEFAGLCNVGTRFLSELENGKATLEFDRVIKVARALGIILMARERR